MRTCTLTVLATTESGITMIRMVLVHSNSPTAMSIKVPSFAEREVDLVSISIQMEISSMVCLFSFIYSINIMK